MCHAYCTHLNCDTILDGNPLSTPQGSENACGNIALSLMSLVLNVKRSEIDVVEAMDELDEFHCFDGCLPPCDGGD